MRKKHIKRKPKARKKGLPRVSILWRFIALCHRLILKPTVLGGVFVLIGLSWFFYSGTYHATMRVVDTTSQKVASLLGLKLEDVYLEGQQYTNNGNVLNAMSVKIGQPLLSIDIQAMKQRLENLTWVKYAVVERQYPSTLSVSMVERKPAALWQYQGRVRLIDEDGETIAAQNLLEFSDLIILVGKDVPAHASSLLYMIKKYPNTEHLVSSAVRVGERRWDIHLFNDIKIKLPEDNPEQAWQFLSKKHEENDILNGQIQTIDLKIPDKMYIKHKA